ncbi:sce7726 family protein [uncultured Anaerovibrio sp.]|uniref:sce7726 family protein n=1 Tax=uncultured Anaerovibrio sp. TaxID=361586 RepID=UPI0025CCEE97|nr:sce7726 family protein [uncultured Anaerovibrio sp.]
MNDKEIRRILISFLKARCETIRIYQEKSIGGSICDMMVVTDCITGFEIKSDLDNYSRIGSQVTNYQKFFNKNYIVVGKAHELSVAERVPNSWGIIVVTPNNIEISRKASLNIDMRLESQLSILWKLELSNLLNYFRLPMYSTKGKRFISEKLIENVPKNQLTKQIAYELLHRDYSIYDAMDYTIYNEDALTLDEYMHELVDDVSERDQLSLDQWIEIYNRSQKVRKIKEEKLQMCRERPKHDITWEDIEVSPGVPWVSKAIITDFARYLLSVGGDKITYNRTIDVKVNYEPITGNWHIERKNSADCYVNATVKYGLKNYNAMFIFEATLNNREMKLFTTDGEYDEESTLVAIEKQKQIIDLFKAWVWQDEDRKWEIEENYNNLFGKYKLERYDGSELEFPEMNINKELFDYQKDAVQRIISRKNTLLAFDVGAGKTFIMIAAAMIMRQKGISRKNMFVVPNNIVGQWSKIFMELYPHARLLVIDPKSFKNPVRDKVMQQMKDGDYDGIIIAYSCFEMIPLSINYITSVMHDKVDMIENLIKRLPYESGSIRALENEKKSLIKLTKELIESMDYKSFTITFDELEIGTLFLDEAHNYKNLPVKTKLKNIRGINTAGSKKCSDMLQKVRYVQESAVGRGVVFATGTPLCNSLADVYIMQVYLQNDDLIDRHLDVFDNWIKTFTRPERVAEIDVNTRHYRYVNRLVKFFNLPELSKMFSDIAVFHAMGKEDGVPDQEEYKDQVIAKNNDLHDYMITLADRTEKIRSGAVNRKDDNMLKVSTDGRKAALDLRLVKREQPFKTSKVICCISNVLRIYNQYEGCSQLVFCDYSTPKKDEFNVYNAVKAGLIARGVSEKEIAFIHSYRTEDRKLALYRKVNEGKIRILIGSTFKLGIGANVQTKLKAIHHLDVPWRPADMVQREGRILRKGNQYDEVFIFRYICEGSFDAYSWQILESKQKFISQFLMGSAYQRSISDLEENVLSFAEVKALALSDPRMKTLAEKENQLINLRIVNRKAVESRSQMEKDIESTKQVVEMINKQIEGSKLNHFDLKNRKENDYKLLRKTLTVILEPRHIHSGNKNLGEAWGFNFNVPEQQEHNTFVFTISRNGVTYSLESGNSASGNAQRVTNFFKGLDTYILELEEKVKTNEYKLTKLKEEIARNNPYCKQIKKLEKEIRHLRAKIEESS